MHDGFVRGVLSMEISEPDGSSLVTTLISRVLYISATYLLLLTMEREMPSSTD